MERYAHAIHLALTNVRLSRQRAKVISFRPPTHFSHMSQPTFPRSHLFILVSLQLGLAQQLYHEKKLSLLKTQHMIELLHKSQEMFFEAGSGQFDDCNAVCMHSVLDFSTHRTHFSHPSHATFPRSHPRSHLVFLCRARCASRSST